MPIDPVVALGAAPWTYPVRWTPSDVQLYHLALGAGARPTDPDELRYCYERDLQVLPTFAVVAGGGAGGPTGGRGLNLPGIEVDLAAVLHGGQQIEVHRPVPPSAELAATARV